MKLFSTRNVLTATAFTAAIATGTATQADVVYVDATTSNTTPDGFSSGDSGSNTNWDFRADLGTSLGNDGIYESYGTAEDPELTTTVTGLSAGTYDIYVFWLSIPGSDGNNWPIRAGLTSNPGANQLYDQDGNVGADPDLVGAVGGTLASTLTFSGGDPVATNQNLDFAHYYTILGQVTVGDGGSFSVYVDDLPTSQSTNRTWYDGVGYAAVPEPSSLALLGLGGLMLGRRRHAS